MSVSTRRLGALAAREIEIAIDQRSISATSDLSSATLGLAEQLERELHPGQRRAQIVRHAGQHFGALANLPLDASRIA